ncbi:MAG: DUF3048 domain-containing protein [Eubacteriales bacterium]
MKKQSLTIALILLCACFSIACGKKDATTYEIDDVQTESDSASTEDVDQDSDVPPAEGMVRSDLTNEWISEEQASTRPIAVMMPTDEVAQPQYGIGNADILYECMEEGSISRQLAVIDDWQDLEQIGNVRSCRLYYLFMACEWDPIVVHFGGVYYMRDRILAGDINNITGTYSDGTTETTAPGNGAFYRTDENEAPHNAYVSGASLLTAIDSLNYELTTRDEYYISDHFQFASAGTTSDLSALEGITAMDATEIDFSDVFPVTKSYLEYNEEDGLYYKYLNGSEQIDAITGEQLTFTNIIVQNTYYAYAPDDTYLVFQMHDTTRDGYFITGGQAIHVTWTKTSDYEPTRYYDDNGDEIVLNTGKTYIAIAQYDTEVIIQ